MVQQKYQRKLKLPVRRGPAGIAQRQTFASVVSNLVPSYSAPSTTTPTFSTAVSFSASTSSVVSYTSISVHPLLTQFLSPVALFYPHFALLDNPILFQGGQSRWIWIHLAK